MSVIVPGNPPVITLRELSPGEAASSRHTTLLYFGIIAYSVLIYSIILISVNTDRYLSAILVETRYPFKWTLIFE